MADPQAPQRLFRNSRREAIVVVIVWALALVWSVGYCYLFGYQHEDDSWVVEWGLAGVRGPDDFQHYLGIPDWVLIGILIPWLICTIFTFFFALYGISDDDLGVEAEEEKPHGH